MGRFLLGPWPFFPVAVAVIGFVTMAIRGFSRAAAMSPDSSTTFTVIAPNLGTAVVTAVLGGGLVWLLPRVFDRIAPRSGPIGRGRYLLVCATVAVILAPIIHIVTRTVFADGGIDEQATLAVSLGFSTPSILLGELLLFGLLGTIDARLRRNERLLAEQLDAVELQRAAVLAAEERVRREIAGSLHDDIQTRLLRIAMQLSGVRGYLDATARDAVDDAISELEDVREHGVRSIGRRLAPDLGAVGLLPSLRESARAFDGVMDVDFAFDEAVRDRFGATGDPSLAALAVYRITEQALQNALKHGRATHAEVSLRSAGGDAVALEVVADGAMPPAEAEPGEGTRLIEAWLAEVGGSWTLEPRPEGGSRFAAVVGD